MLRDDFGRLQRLTPTLKPEEVFLRDRAQRTFGRRTVRELELKLLERALTPRVHPLMKAVDLALDAYDIYKFVQPGGGVPIPRDPAVRSDVEITFDPAKWDIYDQDTWRGNYTAAAGAAPVEDGSLLWTYSFSQGWLRDNDMGDLRVLPAQEIVDGLWDHCTSWVGLEPVNLMDPAHGTIISAVRTVPGAGAEWANPQRVTPSEVSVVALPRAAEAPLPTYQEMPSQARDPWTEVGPDPAPSDVPWVPPTLIFDPVPDPDSPPNEGVDPRPKPGDLPLPDPDLDWPPVSRPNPAPTQRKPPEAQTKERKVRMRRKGVALALYHIGGPGTEALDLLDALYDALPKECKKRRFPTPQEKAMAVYRCSDHLDLVGAFENIWRQNGDDSVWAFQGKLDQMAAERAGFNRGFMFGPWDSNMDFVMKALQRQQRLAKQAARKAAAKERAKTKKIFREQSRKQLREQRKSARDFRREDGKYRKRERAAVKKAARAYAKSERKRQRKGHFRFIQL